MFDLKNWPNARTSKKSLEWTQLAQQLGLAAYRTLEPFGEDDSFQQNEARLGDMEPGPLDSRHALRGTRHGSSFLLWQYTTADLALADSRKYENNHEVQWWTTVAVPLDPPLGFGLHLAKTRFLDSFREADQQLGFALADKALRIRSLDQRKLQSLLSPRNAADVEFLTALSKGAADNLIVTDSMVRFRLPGRVAHAERLDRFIAAAAWFRMQIEARIPNMVVVPSEQMLRHQWHELATVHRLTFDPARMRLHGTLEGIPVQLALVSGPMRLQASVSVSWPKPLPVPLEVSKAILPPDAHRDIVLGRALHRVMMEIVNADLKIGDPVFDDTFFIQGESEAARTLLGPPLLRKNLVAIAGRSESVYFTRHGLSWFMNAPLANHELAEHLRLAVQTAHVYFPPAGGGYR